jgi:2-haloacid dehalogenase
VQPPRASVDAVDAVVFDLGGVLIDWNPRYLYRSLLPDDEAIEAFLEDIEFHEWNTSLDAGRDWDEAVDWLAARHPGRRDLITAFRDRWEETLGGPIQPVAEILEELRAAGTPTFALSNWSRRTFEVTASRFPFLAGFDGLVISGDVGATKPDPRIYRELLERYGLQPQTTVLIDDRVDNVAAATRLGMRGIVFVGAEGLRRELVGLNLPVALPDRLGRLIG